MPHKSNPFLPVDRARDKQIGTDIGQVESTQQFNEERAELQRQAKERKLQDASNVEAADES
jgi:hypothetical protein